MSLSITITPKNMKRGRRGDTHSFDIEMQSLRDRNHLTTGCFRRSYERPESVAASSAWRQHVAVLRRPSSSSTILASNRNLRLLHLPCLLLLLLFAFLMTSSVNGLAWNRSPVTPNGFIKWSVVPIAEFAMNIINQDPQTNKLIEKAASTCDPQICSASCPISGGYSCLSDGSCVCGQLLVNVGDYDANGQPSSNIFVSIWPPELSSSGFIHWVQIPPPPIMFFPKFDGTLDHVSIDVISPPKQLLLMFGGANVLIFNSLWAYDIQRNEWTGLGPPPIIVTPLTACVEDLASSYLNNGTVDMCQNANAGFHDANGCPWPIVRTMHQTAVVNGNLFLFGGGFGEAAPLGDLWYLPLGQQILDQIEVQRTSPDGLYVQPNVTCPITWIPLTQMDNPDLVSSGTYFANLTGAAADAVFPSSRYAHQMVAFNGALFITGGTDGTNYFADCWMLDVSDLTNQLVWIQLTNIILPSSGVPLTVPWARTSGTLSTFSNVLVDSNTGQLVPTAGANGTQPTLMILAAGYVPLIAALGLPTDNNIWAMGLCSSMTTPLPTACLGVNASTTMIWSKLPLTGIDQFPKYQDDVVFAPLPDNQLLVASCPISINHGLDIYRVTTNSVTPMPIEPVPSYVVPDIVSPTSTFCTAQRPVPPRRQLFPMCLIGRIVWLHGGINMTDALTDTWTYEVDRDIWVQHPQTFPSPSAYRPIGGCVGTELWSLFGHPTKDDLTYLNDIWRFETTTLTWTNVTDVIKSVSPWNLVVDGNPADIGGEYRDGFIYPMSRVDGTLTPYGRDGLLLYGGEIGTNEVKLADLWLLNTTTLTWTLINAQNITQDQGQIMSFIGRAQHSAGLDEAGENFIIGFGLTTQGQPVSDCARFNFASQTWISINSFAAAQFAPSVRYASAATVLYNKFYLWGGEMDSTLNDLYALDTHTWVWQQLDAPGQSYLSPASARVGPTGRTGASLISLPFVNRLLLFGGSHGDQQGSLHILDLDQFQVGFSSAVCPSGSIPTGSSDVLARLPFNPRVWNKDGVSSPTGPYPRFTHSRIGSAISFAQIAVSGFIEIQICTTQDLVDATHGLGLTTISQPMRLINAAFSGDGQPQVPGAARIQFDCNHQQCLDVNTAFSVAPVDFVGIQFMNGRGVSGGGFNIVNSSVTFTACDFINHEATRFGGAIGSHSAQILLNNCRFDHNFAAFLGGAIMAIDSSITMIDTNFTNNWVGTLDTDPAAVGYGLGGACFLKSTAVTADGCLWMNNVAQDGGGMMVSTPVSIEPTSMETDSTDIHPLTITNSNFINNSATRSGGALYLSHLYQASSPPTFVNVSFEANSAVQNGAGIYLDRSLCAIANSSFALNFANSAGGGIFWLPDSTDIQLVNGPQLYDTTFNQQLNNSAIYGLDLASPAITLQILDSSAGLVPQASGQIITPPIKLALTDQYGQVVSTDQESFISIVPITSFSGITTVRVVNGIATFDQVVLGIPPTSNIRANFTSSLSLTALETTQLSGNLTILIQSKACVPGQMATDNQCLDCSPGTYSTTTMSPVCDPCPPGSYSLGTGSTICTLCAIGSSNSIFGLSVPCPYCSPTLFAWSKGSTQCQACDDGLTCADGSGTANAGRWLVPIDGSQSTNTSGNIDTDLIGRTLPCPYFNCLANSTCGANRIMPASENILCGACLDGFSEIDRECVQCTSIAWGNLVGIIILILVFTFLIHVLAQSPSSSATLQLLFYYLQIQLLQLGGTERIGVWASWVHLFDFNPLRISGTTCVVPVDAYDSLAISLFSPLVLCAAIIPLAGVNCVLRLCRKNEPSSRTNAPDSSRTRSDDEKDGRLDWVEKQEAKEEEEKVVDIEYNSQANTNSGSVQSDSRQSMLIQIRRLVSFVSFDRVSVGRTLLSIYLFSYTSVTLAIFSHLVCISVGNGQRVVFADPVMDCNSSQYQVWLGVLIILLIGFVIVAPLVIGIHLWRQHKRHVGESIGSDLDESAWRRMENLSVQPMRKDDLLLPKSESTQSQSDTTSLTLLSELHSISGLLREPYGHRAYAWQMIVLLRRALFVALNTALIDTPPARFLSYGLLNFVLFCTHLLVQPYRHAEENHIETVNMGLLLVTSFILQFSVSFNPTTADSEPYPLTIQIIIFLLIVLPSAFMIYRIIFTYLKRRLSRRGEETLNQVNI